MELNFKKKQTYIFLVAILLIAVVAGVVANMLTKQVQIDPVTGEEAAGGFVSKGKLSLKGLKPSVVK